MKSVWEKVKVKYHGGWHDCVTRRTTRGGKVAVRFRNEFGSSMWVSDNPDVIKYHKETA